MSESLNLLHRRDASSKNEPVILTDTMVWSGNDGPWSSFPVFVGQNDSSNRLAVLPSTSLGQTWVIDPTGCPDKLKQFQFGVGNGGKKDSCEISRGVYNGIPSNDSRVYDLSSFQILKNYGHSFQGMGFNTNVSIGFPGSRISDVQLSPVIAFGDLNFSWTGFLGLDPKPLNFSDQGGWDKPKPSLLQNLRESGKISSLSWGYHVGKRWIANSSTGVPAALALSGYHINRIIRHDYKFDFYRDDEQALTLTVRNIKINGVSSNSTLPSGVSRPFAAWVDSTRPYLYLPEETYDAILKNLGLTLDSTSDHVLISDQQHQQFLNSNFSLEFTLSNYVDQPNLLPTNNTVTINVPYESLALKLGFPYLRNPALESWYLPIRKGNQDMSNYILGRAFLQEAYVMADYENRFFKVHAINWTSIAASKKDVVALIEPKPKPQSSIGPSKVIIAASVVGAVGFLLAVFLICCMVSKRRKKKAKKLEMEKSSSSPTSPGALEAKLAEADSATIHELPNAVAVEAVEMEAKTVIEMPDYNGTLGTHYKPAELDPEAEQVLFEMEGSPGLWNDEKGAMPPIISRLDTNIVTISSGEGTSATASSLSSSGVSSLSTNPNSGSTVGSGVDSLPKSKGPKIRIVPAPELSTGWTSNNPVPASPIPQTPLEYYGGHIPESRMNRAIQRLRAAERGELPLEMVRNAGVPIPPVPAIPTSAASLPVKTRNKGGPGKSDEENPKTRLPPIVTILENPESTENTRAFKEEHQEAEDSSNDDKKTGLDVPKTPTPIPASPIPQTPLEFYGRAPGLRGPLTDRQWVGRAPEVPSVNLIPATPLTPNSDNLSRIRAMERIKEDKIPPKKNQ